MYCPERKLDRSSVGRYCLCFLYSVPQILLADFLLFIMLLIYYLCSDGVLNAVQRVEVFIQHSAYL